MKAAARALVLVLATTACGGRVKAPAPPAPAQPAAKVAVTRPARDTTPKADSVARVAVVDIPDSVVTRQAAAVFGDSVAPQLPDSSGVDAPTWDIDVRSYETHRRVEFYVNAFTGSARERFIARLEKGSRYEPMIREKLRAGNIPEDMFYLALVESGFDQHAYSRAAAVGMWQFMTATARGTGLRVDWWVDERRDPVRSTEGAVKLLGWLREEFGSLYLAAAAYNGGSGRVSRGLSRLGDDLDGGTRDDAFFALADHDYLRSETKNYVPQLIAAALVAKEPAKYGMKIRTLPPLAYDSVSVPASTPLTAIARASRSPLDSIRELNPQILRGVTPPGSRVRVRVPVGHAEGFDSTFAALAPDVKKAYTHVETKKGQTFASVAATHGLSARQLKWYNPKVTALKSGRLRTGQDVLVPSRAVVNAALDIPDPSIEIYGSRSGSRTHVVRRGETLGGIAKKYGTSVSSLMRLNGLKKAVIHPGQQLVVRGTPRRSTIAKGSTKARSPAKSTVTKSTTAKSTATKPATTKSTAAKARPSTKSSSSSASAPKTSSKPKAVAKR
jgi:peptidoglycan lytic transglycosylase D